MSGGVVTAHGSMVIFVAGFSIALLVSFFCSLMEAALLSLSPGQLAQLRARRPRAGEAMARFKADLDRPITAILSLNTAAHTLGATIAGAEFALLFGDRWLGLFSGVFTYLMLQYTEILPKSLGVRYNIAISGRMAGPLAVLIRILYPLIGLLRLVNRPFEPRAGRTEGTVPTEELVALAGHARLSHQITTHQEGIITGAARLSDKKALDVMVPVDQITFLSADHTLSQAVITAHMDPHTRFPVIRANDRNAVLGYVNFKELVYRARTNPADPTLKGVVRPLRFVRRDTSCQEILRAFVDEHEHMAIVRDEQGRTAGLITLEDMVEELLGRLPDEFDRPPRMCHALAGGVWLVGGGLLMTELADRMGRPSLAGPGRVSDWVTSRFGAAPVVDGRLEADGLEFTVRRMRRGAIFELLVSPVHVPPAGRKAVGGG